MLYNPFGPREGFDVPHKSVSIGIRRMARELCKVQLPATMSTSNVRPTRASFLDEKNVIDESICFFDSLGSGDTLFKSLFHSGRKKKQIHEEE